MALTIATTARTVFGNKRVVVGTIGFDSDYATGGEAFAASSLGIGKIEILVLSNAAGFTFEYDYTNAKIKAYSVTAGTAGGALGECASGTSLTGVSALPFMAIGYGKG